MENESNEDFDIMCIGSKTVIGANNSCTLPFWGAAVCVMNEAGMPQELSIGTSDIAYPFNAENGVAKPTLGLLRCIEDYDNLFFDLHSLKMFPSKSRVSSKRLLIVPDPLGIKGRECLLNTLRNDEEIHPQNSKYVYSFSESLVLSFLQSQEGLDLLEQNMGAIKLLLANIGEDFCFVSAIQVDAIFPHHHLAVNECNQSSRVDQTEAVLCSNDDRIINHQDGNLNGISSFTKKTVVEETKCCIEFDNLQISVVGSEGHMGFGLQDMDEVVLQDWLAVLFHLAKCMKVKKVNNLVKLSIEALERSSKPLQKISKEGEIIEENVNVIEGFRWWVKLCPNSRSRCLQAMSLFRSATNHKNNVVSKTQPFLDESLSSNLSWYNQLLKLETLEEQVKLLSEFLLDECDSVLQTLTGWVTIQGNSILYQLLQQYGKDKIKLNVKNQSSNVVLYIDGTREFFLDENQSQSDSVSMADNGYYDIYSRPMLRSQFNQLFKNLKRKVNIILDPNKFGGDDYFDTLLIWSEFAQAPTVGDNNIVNIICDEAASCINFRSNSPSTLRNRSHYAEHYSCGSQYLMPFDVYRLYPKMILEGIRNIGKLSVIDPSPNEMNMAASSNPVLPFCHNVSLTEVVCSSAWCGNLGFALVFEDSDLPLSHIEVSSADVVWLTDFQSACSKSLVRRKLKDMNQFLLHCEASEKRHGFALTTADNTLESHCDNHIRGYLSVHNCHSQILDVNNGDLHIAIDRLSHVAPSTQFFFLQMEDSNLLLGNGLMECENDEHCEMDYVSNEYKMLVFEIEKDLYRKAETMFDIRLHRHHSILDESNISSASILSASHLPPHEEQQLRHHHLLYQRHNRHRLGHSTRHRHLRQFISPHYFQMDTTMEIDSPHISFHAHLSSPSYNNHTSTYETESLHHSKVWKLVLVRSSSFYVAGSAVSALLDNSDGQYSEALVQENIHALHAVKISDGAELNLNNGYIYVTLNISGNGVIGLNASMPLNKADMLNIYPLPPPVEIDNGEIDALKKEEEIDKLKHKWLSLLSLLDPADNVTQTSVQLDRSDSVKSSLHSPTDKKKLSARSSRLATLSFSGLFLLYFTFFVFLVTKLIFALYSGNEVYGNVQQMTFLHCDARESSTQTSSHSMKFDEFLSLGKSSLIDSDDEIDSNTIDELEDEFSYESLEIDNPLLLSKATYLKESQTIFARDSQINLFRRTFRRLRGTFVETFDSVKNILLLTLSRFPFNFMGNLDI